MLQRLKYTYLFGKFLFLCIFESFKFTDNSVTVTSLHTLIMHSFRYLFYACNEVVVKCFIHDIRSFVGVDKKENEHS